jgi:hypothetical protein
MARTDSPDQRNERLLVGVGALVAPAAGQIEPDVSETVGVGLDCIGERAECRLLVARRFVLDAIAAREREAGNDAAVSYPSLQSLHPGKGFG